MQGYTRFCQLLCCQIVSFLSTIFIVAVPSVSFAGERIVTTTYPTSDYVCADLVVTESPFNASRNGLMDASLPIQHAINTVAAEGGGTVFIPSGRYRCDSCLLIRQGVTLRGDWKAPTDSDGHNEVGGTVLMPTAGAGSVDGTPFIQLQRGSGVRDMSIWYPDQQVQQITPYPWTIANDLAMDGDSFTVEQVTLVNSYQGIKFGPDFIELPTISEVYGTPLHIGVSLDNVTDVARITGVHFAPKYWADSQLPNAPTIDQVTAKLRTDAIGMEFGRSDWQDVNDVSIDGYSVGMKFYVGTSGRCFGVMYEVKISGGETGIVLDQLELGLALTGCRISGDTTGIYASPLYASDVELNDCEIDSGDGQAISEFGDGTLRLQNCTISGGVGQCAVDAKAGSVTLVACRIIGPGKQVALEQDVKRAQIVGNIFDGLVKDAIANESKADVQIDTGTIVSPIPLDVPMYLVQHPTPPTSRLFNVLDFGANPVPTTGYSFPPISTLVDNTPSIQAALYAAGKAGGGTVYVPPGYYLCNGCLHVPTGVELRGCFDIPHHMVSLGSVLLPTDGRGNENGVPFIRLEQGSGAKGLSIWYPNQLVENVAPYPWTFQAMGAHCWLIDDSVANAYRLADFATYNCPDHLIQALEGCALHVGILVGSGGGILDSCHLNPHEWLRGEPQSPPATMSVGTNPFLSVVPYLAANLDAFVIDNGNNEQLIDDFVFSSYRGLTVTGNGSSPNTLIAVNFGVDHSSTGVCLTEQGKSEALLVNPSIAILDIDSRTAIDESQQFAGELYVYNGYSFGNNAIPTMLLSGGGHTTIEGLNSSLGPIYVAYGNFSLEDCLLPQPLRLSVVVDKRVAHLSLVSNSAGPGSFTFDPGPNVEARDNGVSIPLEPLVDSFSWPSPGGLPPDLTRLPQNNASSDTVCQVVNHSGLKGKPAILLEGVTTAGEHGTYYYHLFKTDIVVKPTTMFRYWIKPESAFGRETGVDLYFSQGPALRDLSVNDTCGHNMHPGSPRGIIGKWTSIESPIGKSTAGKTITDIVFAFDGYGDGSPVKSEVSDIEIGEPAGGGAAGSR